MKKNKEGFNQYLFSGVGKSKFQVNKKGAGFTLIELLVVIAIIGLLSTLAIVSLNNARSKSRDARRKSDVKAIQTAIEYYRDDNDGLFGLPSQWSILSGFIDDYIAGGAPTDPGSNVYTLCINPAGSGKYLVSAVLENETTYAGLNGNVTYSDPQCTNEDNDHLAPDCDDGYNFCIGAL